MALAPIRASVPVVTDATSASAAELDEAVRLFLPAAQGPFAFERCGGGVNNKCYLCSASSPSAQYVLRIYNNGRNTRRVRYEHEVLRQLALRAAALAPVRVPLPLPPLAPEATQTFATLSTGAEACIFEVIPGSGPALSSSANIGAATARLVACMADIVLDADAFPLPNPLYRNMWDSHHSISRSVFLEIVRGADFDGVRADTNYLCAEIDRAEFELIPKILAENTHASQQIHADLHFDNVLTATDGEVTGILDFEFSAFDWRVMELVVGLSKYAGMKSPEKLVEEYIAGYGRGGGRLTRSECELIPDLIILRVLSNVIYFAGRAHAGEDSIAALVGRVGVYAQRCRWLHAERAWLVGVALAGLCDEKAAGA